MSSVSGTTTSRETRLEFDKDCGAEDGADSGGDAKVTVGRPAGAGGRGLSMWLIRRALVLAVSSTGDGVLGTGAGVGLWKLGSGLLAL